MAGVPDHPVLKLCLLMSKNEKHFNNQQYKALGIIAAIQSHCSFFEETKPWTYKQKEFNSRPFHILCVAALKTFSVYIKALSDEIFKVLYLLSKLHVLNTRFTVNSKSEQGRQIWRF